MDPNGKPLGTRVAGRNNVGETEMTEKDRAPATAILRKTLGGRIDYFETIDRLRTPGSRFVYIAKYVPVWQAKDALDALATYPGILAEKIGLRSYPGGRLAANLIGFVDAAGVGQD